MKSKIRRPGWWLLFVLLIGMLGLILLESQDGVPNSVHEIIDGVIILGFFGSLIGWLHVNQSALEQSELEHANLDEFHFVEYEPTRPASMAQQSPKNKYPVDGNASFLPKIKRKS